MSGGVDSSVAAFLLLEQGYRVTGVTIDTGYGDAPEAAARVCRELVIEHTIVDLREGFRSLIIDNFVRDYAEGITPSPCLRCNPLIKFAALFGQRQEKTDLIATGHYVRRLADEENGMYYLTCGDQAKDQSYFLCLLDQEQIAHCLFPLGRLNKAEVRAIARKHDLCCADKKDSFDVCFVPGGDYRTFLSSCGVTDAPGEIVDHTGQVLGRHNGLSNYTIGQRRGLDVALGYPAHVLQLDSRHNRLIIGSRDMLYRQEADLYGCVFQSVPSPSAEFRCQVRVRHKASLSPAALYPLPEKGRDSYRLIFDEPEWGLTPGQYAAFYNGDRLLGGGRFSR